MNVLGSVPMTPESIAWDVFQLGVAYVLALPIGWDREHELHAAGIRTFPIVAVASCGLAMVGTHIPGASTDSYSRILQGLVTGIGFVGGGAILRDSKGAVSGTATAASVWSIGIVGASVGFGMYHIAVVLALINLLTLKYMRRLQNRVEGASGPKSRQEPEI
jgi:putative Mg2+ transporter-C (MgtC) family protein